LASFVGERCNRFAGPRHATPQRFDFTETAHIDQSSEVAANVAAAGRLGPAQCLARFDGPGGVAFLIDRSEPGRWPVEPLGEGHTHRAAEERRRSIDQDRRDLLAGVAPVRIGERARIAIPRQIRQGKIECLVAHRVGRSEPRADEHAIFLRCSLHHLFDKPTPSCVVHRRRGDMEHRVVDTGAIASAPRLACDREPRLAVAGIEPCPLQRVDQLAAPGGVTRRRGAGAIGPGIDLRVGGVDGQPRQRLGAAAGVTLALFARGAFVGPLLAEVADATFVAIASGAKIEPGSASSRLGIRVEGGKDGLHGLVALARREPILGLPWHQLNGDVGTPRRLRKRPARRPTVRQRAARPPTRRPRREGRSRPPRPTHRLARPGARQGRSGAGRAPRSPARSRR
jgi:hypothetical protein